MYMRTQQPHPTVFHFLSCANFVLCGTADEIRSRIRTQTGRQELAHRLVPMQPGDSENAARGRLLFGALFRQLSPSSTTLQVYFHALN